MSPQFQTFDGKIYEISEICQGGSDGVTIVRSLDFQIDIQPVPCQTLQRDCSYMIKMAMPGGTQVTIAQGTGVILSLDDVTKTFTTGTREWYNQFYISIDYATVFQGHGISIYHDGGQNIRVELDKTFIGNVSGMCGNNNGNLDDDFQDINGQGLMSEIELYNMFKDENCPPVTSVTGEDKCLANEIRKPWAVKSCEIIKVGATFSDCRKSLTIPVVNSIYDHCVQEACGCDRGGDCECLCTAISNFADMCNSEGFPVRWRHNRLCPMQCDYGSKYLACGPMCQDTCFVNLTNSECSRSICIEGCFCPNGTVIADHDGPEIKCIPKSECPCVVDGTLYMKGQYFLKNCMNCSCVGGEIACTGQNCTELCDKSTTYKCLKGRCIPLTSYCDGILDCPGGDDEKGCGNCTEFTCANGDCILYTALCDGVVDCRQDQSDESYELCGVCIGKSLFNCSTAKLQCIDASFVCDENNDCTDGSDEKNCTFCEKDFIHCNKSACIARNYTCDGFMDCDNGVDELGCTTPQVTSPSTTVCDLECLAVGTLEPLCITPDQECDGIQHCDSGQDELLSKCVSTSTATTTVPTPTGTTTTPTTSVPTATTVTTIPTTATVPTTTGTTAATTATVPTTTGTTAPTTATSATTATVPTTTGTTVTVPTTTGTTAATVPTTTGTTAATTATVPTTTGTTTTVPTTIGTTAATTATVPTTSGTTAVTTATVSTTTGTTAATTVTVPTTTGTTAVTTATVPTTTGTTAATTATVPTTTGTTAATTATVPTTTGTTATVPTTTGTTAATTATVPTTTGTTAATTATVPTTTGTTATVPTTTGTTATVPTTIGTTAATTATVPTTSGTTAVTTATVSTTTGTTAATTVTVPTTTGTTAVTTATVPTTTGTTTATTATVPSTTGITTATSTTEITVGTTTTTVLTTTGTSTAPTTTTTTSTTTVPSTTVFSTTIKSAPGKVESSPTAGGCQSLLDFDELNVVIEANLTSVSYSGTNITWTIPDHAAVEVYSAAVVIPNTYFTSLEITANAVTIKSISTYINSLLISVTQDTEVSQLSITLKKFGDNLTVSVETNASALFSLDLAVKGCSQPIEVPTTTRPPVSVPGLQCTGDLDLLSKDGLNQYLPSIVEFGSTSSVEEVEVEIPNVAFFEIYDVALEFSANVSAYIFDGTEFVPMSVDGGSSFVRSYYNEHGINVTSLKFKISKETEGGLVGVKVQYMETCIKLIRGCQSLLDFDELDVVIEANLTLVSYSGTNITWTIPDHAAVEAYSVAVVIPNTYFTSLEITANAVTIKSISMYINSLLISVTPSTNISQLSITLNKFGDNLTVSVETNASAQFSLDLAVKGCSQPIEVPSTTRPPVSVPGLQCTGDLDLLSKDGLNQYLPSIVEFGNTSSVEEVEVEIPNVAFIELYDVALEFSANVSAYIFDGTEFVPMSVDGGSSFVRSYYNERGINVTSLKFKISKETEGGLVGIKVQYMETCIKLIPTTTGATTTGTTTTGTTAATTATVPTTTGTTAATTATVPTTTGTTAATTATVPTTTGTTAATTATVPTTTGTTAATTATVPTTTGTTAATTATVPTTTGTTAATTATVPTTTGTTAATTATVPTTTGTTAATTATVPTTTGTTAATTATVPTTTGTTAATTATVPTTTGTTAATTATVPTTTGTTAATTATVPTTTGTAHYHWYHSSDNSHTANYHWYNCSNNSNSAHYHCSDNSHIATTATVPTTTGTTAATTATVPTTTAATTATVPTTTGTTATVPTTTGTTAATTATVPTTTGTTATVPITTGTIAATTATVPTTTGTTAVTTATVPTTTGTTAATTATLPITTGTTATVPTTTAATTATVPTTIGTTAATTATLPITTGTTATVPTTTAATTATVPTTTGSTAATTATVPTTTGTTATVPTTTAATTATVPTTTAVTTATVPTTTGTTGTTAATTATVPTTTGTTATVPTTTGTTATVPTTTGTTAAPHLSSSQISLPLFFIFIIFLVFERNWLKIGLFDPCIFSQV
ncbi:mucin-2-like [Gigantopelta aegis]|uniref:mucin-2-like n=1 Tax=Gigantopelta aegis TaxID=1735272 RepID=UPI001B88AA18|nr:mucin-2-like [Gigantopelta aegis]